MADSDLLAGYEVVILSDSQWTAIAVKRLCDEFYEREIQTSDSRKLSFALGRIGRHRVFMADRPQGDLIVNHYLRNMTLEQHFNAVKLVLLVGHCGAVPFVDSHEEFSDISIALGDVIVGNDIVQYNRADCGWYDYSKQSVRMQKLKNEFEKRRLRARAFVEELEGQKEQFEAETTQHLVATLEQPMWKGYQHLRTKTRKIFRADYLHRHRDGECLKCEYTPEPCYDAERSSCEQLGCEASHQELHGPHKQSARRPAAHFGPLLMGCSVRSTKDRDRLAKMDGVIGFASQAAGLWHCLPVVMVKGVAHHADGHNFDTWKQYTGAVAASAAACILNRWDHSTGLQRPTRDPYISLFVEDLLGRASRGKPERRGLAELYEAMPGLLETFAIKARAEDSWQMVQDAMSFLRKHRYEITRAVSNRYMEENILGSDSMDVDEDDASGTTRDTPLKSAKHDIDEAPGASGEIQSNISVDPIHFLPDISDFMGVLIHLLAYKWLVGDVQKVLYLGLPQGKPVGIRTAILEYLPKARWNDTSPRHSLTFTAKWDPRSFLLEQKYAEDPDNVLERAITITGSTTDAQAVTMAQYLGQTWPSTGHHFVRIMKDVVISDSNTPYTYDLPDGTRVAVWAQGPQFTLEVIGIAESIAEIGEQFAWVAAAFHPPLDDTRVNVVRAFVSEMWSSLSHEQTGKTTFCNIKFDIHVVQHTPTRLNGQCWQRLFRSPVLVNGYPIPRRPNPGIGLEISLDTMAGLLGTDRISIFNNKMYIKTFAMMLFPTQHFGDIIVWHLLWSDRDRVSYLEGKNIIKQELSISDLEQCRHIIGWCTDVKYMIGSADASYCIGRSWLRGVHENSQLKDISISQGRLIKSDHRPVYGKRDISSHVTRGTIRAKLENLSKRYMMLWDVGCKRGWLVNGPSGLLHLLRASIQFNQTDELSFAFLFDSAMFEEAKTPYTVTSALQVLMNPRNLELELYKDDLGDGSNTVSYRVCDRLNDLYEVIEKMMDYQIMICGKDGVRLRDAPRRDLEGWDFKDVATKEDPIYPRLAKLKTVGKGWVDFIRASQAVVLFGRDFGDLIEPSTKTDLCGHWKSLPRDRYYLAASMVDLRRIFDRSGHLLFMHSGPTSFVWHPSEPAFSLSCHYNEGTNLACEPAVTVRREYASFWKLEDCSYTGAVVFGHNTQSEWIWKDRGEPERGSLPLTDAESDDDDQVDSGLGSSLRSSVMPERQGSILGRHDIAGFTHTDYRVAIICALSKELMAIRALFDCSHDDLSKHESDTNTYALGSLGNHNVVAACLPSEEYGTNAASKVASDMEKSFPRVKWFFVVGIGGGVPSDEHDIRLGDVVVSTSVIQHDMGRKIQDGRRFESTAVVQRPARSLMTAINLIRSDPYYRHDCLEPDIERIVGLRPEYSHPGEDYDRLFQPHSTHEHGQRTCNSCTGPEVTREPRSSGPRIHYGRIASGNQVIKDAIMRDQTAKKLNAICFEMEGAGVMTTGHCLVIRGICDYADSHKNNKWHNYAAATAAAYTKFFLLRLRNLDVLGREMVHLQKRTASFLDEGEILTKRLRYED
ncbi:hypothetical protein BJX63DRAFT_427868 [Aspergillus granulosus]|uniref:Nucleoside phosphorylase domain-containing protein n=1 Tax=Aspergillus granulosus TaxID=176169 RepID=A0ABR4I0B8_9EURO